MPIGLFHVEHPTAKNFRLAIDTYDRVLARIRADRVACKMKKKERKKEKNNNNKK